MEEIRKLIHTEIFPLAKQTGTNGNLALQTNFLDSYTYITPPSEVINVIKLLLDSVNKIFFLKIPTKIDWDENKYYLPFK